MRFKQSFPQVWYDIKSHLVFCGKYCGTIAQKISKILVILRKIRLLKTFSSIGEQHIKPQKNQLWFILSSKFSTSMSQIRKSTVSTKKSGNSASKIKIRHTEFLSTIRPHGKRSPADRLSRLAMVKKSKPYKGFPAFPHFPQPLLLLLLLIHIWYCFVCGASHRCRSAS